MDFSVVIIGRNEIKTLPRLTESVKAVEDRFYLDTGSTDGTAEWAEQNGWRVDRVGEKFKYEATQEMYDKFVQLFGMEPSFKVGDKFFHYADARNYANTFSKNDWVFSPDCDEAVTWDLDKVKKELDSEDQLVYRFCFAHRPDGTCGLEFSHCKFFRKSKVKWVGWVHEIHAPVDGQSPKEAKYVDFIYHEHFQNHETKRSNYMGGLELALLENPDNDRNLYYTAREYFYMGQWQRAIDMFVIALKKMWWRPERGQAYLFKSQCHERLNEDAKALECLHLSLLECDTRREPFDALGNYHSQRNQNDQAVSYYKALLGVPFRPHGYLNSMELYGWVPHDKLSQLYAKMGAKDLAKEEWIKAIKFKDCDKRVLSNVAWFYDCKKVSIVVPTCRPEGFGRLEKSIRENTIYPNYEIVKMDGDGTAVDKLNKGVAQSDGEYIVFLADDTEVTNGWLENAFVALKERLNGHGAVSLNDGYWKDTNMGHFLCSRDMVEELGGHLWDPEFFHNGVDPLMYARLRKKGRAIFCEEARIIHHHHYCTTPGAEKDKKDEWALKVEHFMDHDSRLLPKKLAHHGLFADAAKWSKTYMKMKFDGPLDIVSKLGEMGMVPEGLNVLNIGLGDCKSGLGRQLPFMRFGKITHVEKHPPYIEDAKKLEWEAKTEYANEDIMDIKDFGYDLILMFDIIEHLKRKDADRLLSKIGRSDARVMAFVPVEKEPRKNETSVAGQDHLSFWTEDDFRERGYSTALLPNFHGAGRDAFWALK